jgi:hypothetical protein
LRPLFISERGLFMHFVSIQYSFDVDEIIKWINEKKLKPRRVNVNRIHYYGLNRSSTTGFSKRRYKNCDIKIPIIVTSDYGLIDGRHRLFKAIEKGRKTIRIIMIDFNELMVFKLKEKS